MGNVGVHFYMCVHDYDGYGQHTGRLHAAEFRLPKDDLFLHLDCIGRETVCRHIDDNTIRISRNTFTVLSYAAYVGNMMWDAALVSVQTANQIATVLRMNGNYEPDHGTSELWELWDAGMPLFAGAQP